MTEQQIEQLFQLAYQAFTAGRPKEADQLCSRILEANRQHAGSSHLRGVIAGQAGQNELAVQYIRQAIAITPGDAVMHGNLGNALAAAGRLDEAVDAHRRSVELAPSASLGFFNLGNALREKGDFGEAVQAFRRAVALSPDFAEAHNNCGAALRYAGRNDEAIASIRQAIRLRPASAPAYCNLAAALGNLDRLDEAIAAYREAIVLKPDYAGALVDLGTALKDNGQLDDAIAAYRRAVALRPEWADAHYKLALALLKHGEFSDGWQEHEWRWKFKRFPSPARQFPQPQWDGTPLGERRLLVHAEQGLGDTLQFFRYVALVDHPQQIILECDPRLRRLLQFARPAHEIVERGAELPAFDVHAPMMLLPRLFKTTLQNIPDQVPYLNADAAAVATWRARMGDRSHRLKVGLAWAGNPQHTNDENRSISLRTFAPLAGVRNVQLLSLQIGAPALQSKSAPAGLEIIDFSDDLTDFADTAALVANLDLVISVDSAVAHLAGAMAKPVWTLLPFNSDWRWLEKREDSPWYPTMRVFRQERRGDWEGVIARVSNALAERVGPPQAK